MPSNGREIIHYRLHLNVVKQITIVTHTMTFAQCVLPNFCTTTSATTVRCIFVVEFGIWTLLIFFKFVTIVIALPKSESQNNFQLVERLSQRTFVSFLFFFPYISPCDIYNIFSIYSNQCFMGNIKSFSWLVIMR